MVREKLLRVRLNQTEWWLVESLAGHEERKLSEAVRESLREAAARRGLLGDLHGTKSLVEEVRHAAA